MKGHTVGVTLVPRMLSDLLIFYFHSGIFRDTNNAR